MARADTCNSPGPQYLILKQVDYSELLDMPVRIALCQGFEPGAWAFGQHAARFGEIWQNLNLQEICLQLHEHIVGRGAAIHSQAVHILQAHISRHRIHDLLCLHADQGFGRAHLQDGCLQACNCRAAFLDQW